MKPPNTAPSHEEMERAVFGIGTQRVKVLVKHGIGSLEALAGQSVEPLQKLFAGQHPTFSDTIPTWPLQALLALEGPAHEYEHLLGRIRSGRDGSKHLMLLEGLDPDAAAHLHASGFDTYAALADAEEGAIRARLAWIGHTNEDVASLKRQAALAAAADWPALRALWAETAGTGTGPDHDTSGGGDSPSDPTHNPNPAHNPNGGSTMPAQPIVIVDMHERNKEEYERLHQRWFVLHNKQAEADGEGRKLDPRLLDELNGLTETLDLQEGDVPPAVLPVVDPLFKAVQDDLRVSDDPDDYSCTVRDHQNGKFPSQVGEVATAAARSAIKPDKLTDREEEVTAIYGILLRDNATNPAAGRRFSNQVSLGRSEYHAHRALYDRVLEVLVDAGHSHDGRAGERFVRAGHVAAVARTLAEQNVAPDDMHLALKVEAALSQQTHITDEAPGSVFDINLPDLDQQADTEIVVDNIKAMQALYFAAMLGEMRLFQVTDKVLELYEIGYLPFGRGVDSDRLFEFRRKKAFRMSEYERANLVARAFGLPGGDAHVRNPNREFQTLMLRFVAAVSASARQISVDALVRSKVPLGVHQEQVRKAGCDLGANLSLHAYGMAYNAAIEVQNTINDIFAILNGQEVKAAFGARDLYQVIEQVAALELGSGVDTTRYRTLAASGSIIIRWIANHATELCSSGYGAVLDFNEILYPAPHPSGSTPMNSPHDSDLVNACERYLAATGTSEERVAELSSTYGTSSSPSRPIQMPSIARDMLESAGVNVSGDGGFSMPDVGV